MVECRLLKSLKIRTNCSKIRRKKFGVDGKASLTRCAKVGLICGGRRRRRLKRHKTRNSIRTSGKSIRIYKLFRKLVHKNLIKKIKPDKGPTPLEIFHNIMDWKITIRTPLKIRVKTYFFNFQPLLIFVNIKTCYFK